MTKLPHTVTIVEVSPRDGLQNEKVIVPTAVKIELMQRLADCGLKIIESASFVSPKWVPAMADHAEVVRDIPRRSGVSYPALVANARGMERAIAAGIKEVSVF